MLEYGFTVSLQETQAQHSNNLRTLFVAALQCDLSLAEDILRGEGGVDSLFAVLSDGSAPLMLAAYSDCVSVLSLLLDSLAETLILRDDFASHVDLTGTHGLSALSVGVLRGSTRSVALLLDNGADPSQEHIFARTSPLHMAAELGHADIIRILCSRGANVSATTSVGGTALHTAAQVDMARSVAPLVNKCSLSPDELMLADTTALYIAAQQGHDATVRALLSVGADMYYSMSIAATEQYRDSKAIMAASGDEFFNMNMINSEAANGASALHAAAENGHATVVDLLLLHHAEKVSGGLSQHGYIDFVNGQSIGTTALHLAAQYDRPHVASVLLRHGADIDRAAVIDGTSPLYHAISMRSTDTALLLLAAGASPLGTCHPDSKSSARRTSPFILAIMQGKRLLPVLKNMLQRQKAIANHKDCSGVSALHVSAGLEDSTALTLLLEHGGDARSLNADQASILHIIVQHNRLRTARFFLKFLRHNMSPGELNDFVLGGQNTDGFTMLHSAAAGGCGQRSMLRLLLEALEPGAMSRAAFSPLVASPLHLAAADGCVGNVDLLLTAGCKADEVFNDQSVLVTAIKHNHLDVINRLLEEGEVSLQMSESQSKITHNPLLFAVVRGAAAAVEALLDAGADCNIFVLLSSDPTAEPSSLLQIAQQRRDFDTSKILSTHPSCSEVHLEL
mmetsp:Transcript_12224/g.19909  ORF Transcript_12224/g.19909 Transcript_12224/m.19909 type:complete len:680 (-) Transcript_12224:66-2105(-)